MQTAGDDPADSLSGHGATGVVRLKRRAEFQWVGKGRRWHGKALTLQAAARPAMSDRGDAGACAGIGFTLTKKVGCAVVRNRARRRLREAVRLAALPFRPDCDYVIVGRIDAIRLPFDTLGQELAAALRAIHAVDGAVMVKRPAGEPPASDGKTRRGGRIAGTDRAKGTRPKACGPERTRPKP